MSAACAGCKHQLVNVYPTAHSPPDRRQMWNGTALAESRKQQPVQGGGAGAKPVQPRRCAAKSHRGTRPRRGGVARDAQKRAIAERLDEEWAAQRLEALQKRATGRDEKAAWSARMCVSVPCPVTYVSRDKNAARNIAGAGLASLSGASTAPFFHGCRVRRPPRGNGTGRRDWDLSRDTADSWWAGRLPAASAAPAVEGTEAEEDDGEESDTAADEHLLVPQPLPPPAAAVAEATGTADGDDDDVNVEGGGHTSPRQATYNSILAAQQG